jgi:hypothetical protein
MDIDNWMPQALEVSERNEDEATLGVGVDAWRVGVGLVGC